MMKNNEYQEIICKKKKGKKTHLKEAYSFEKYWLCKYDKWL